MVVEFASAGVAAAAGDVGAAGVAAAVAWGAPLSKGAGAGGPAVERAVPLSEVAWGEFAAAANLPEGAA